MLILVLVTFSIFSTDPAFTKSDTFQTEYVEYTYQASEADSKLDCQVIALEQAKRLALEKNRTYVEAQTVVKNFHLTEDQITSLTAGILQTEIVDEKWDGKEYWLKARIIVDPDEVDKSIDALRKDRQKIQELEKTRKKMDEALKENERLRRELDLSLASKQTDQKLLREYKATNNQLKAFHWFMRGSVFMITGNHQEAITAFNKVLELSPNEPKVLSVRGLEFLNLGKYEQAFQDFNKAIELDPKDATLLVDRGLAYADLGKMLVAINDYNKAIELDPEHAMAYSARGMAYAFLSNYSAAISDCTRAIELSPEAKFYATRGGVYKRFGNDQEAINDFKVAAGLGSQEAQNFLTKRGIKW
jgi:tetratricopeptide (TPR) repeat protein